MAIKGALHFTQFTPNISLYAMLLFVIKTVFYSFSFTNYLLFSVHSNERLFLRDFVGCVAGTSGGRLAQWLQPGSRVDPSKCQVLYSREDMKCGWPAIITILTRDQYADLVHVANMKVRIHSFKNSIRTEVHSSQCNCCRWRLRLCLLTTKISMTVTQVAKFAE